jgi:hypothetical protein
VAFVLWQDGEGGGYDRCALLPAVGGATLSGTATLADHGRGATVRYVIRVDHAWRVRDCDVRMNAPAHEARVRIVSRDPGRWTRDDVPLPELDGCVDVSLDFTPVALTPLIRRVDLPRGERVDADVVRLALPHLEVTRARVGIEHDARDRWLHHVDGRAYALHVGPQGLITEYEDAWSAVALG